MTDWQNDLERYRLGKMTPAEMHAFEKRALHDPFLTDALEGAEQIALEDFARDLQELTAKLESTKKIAASAVPSPTSVSSSKPWVWPLRIAASVLLLVGIFWIGNQLIPEDSTQLVLNKEVAPADMKEGSPVSSSAPQDTIESKLAEQPTLPIKEASKRIAARKEKEIAKKREENTTGETIAATQSFASETEPAPVQDSKPIIDDKAEYKLELDKSVSQAEQKADGQEPSRAKRSFSLSSPIPSAQGNTNIAINQIKGQVTSLEDGTPLPGVNVLVKGTFVGTVTNMDGFFQLPNVSPDQKLVFSFIGLQTKEVDASQPQLNVALAPDVSQLSEVVVTGVRNNDDSDRSPIIKLAVPEGGLKAYDAYLDTNLQFPKEALTKRVKGKVAIRFTVRVDGSLDEFKVVKSLGSGCDEEVIRLVKEGPEWSASTEDDVPVESEVLVKVKFDPAKVKN